MKVYLVRAEERGHANRISYPVDVWTAKGLAEKRAERLNWCATQFERALAALRVPVTPDEYDAWAARCDVVRTEWRELSGDENLGTCLKTVYLVSELPLRSRAWRATA